MTKRASEVLKVLHITTHNEDCGIAKYQEQFIEAMGNVAATEVVNDIFPHSPNKVKVMSPDQFRDVLGELRVAIQSHDLVHIQHELSFYRHVELHEFIDLAHSLGKKVVVTVHTAPRALYPEPDVRGGIGPRSFLIQYRQKKAANKFLDTLVRPLADADLILVHNNNTKDDLVSLGVRADNVRIITMPVPAVNHAVDTGEIKKYIHAEPDDVIVGSVGFITKSKGVMDAVRALNFLPDNYKLAIVGGDHPSGVNTKYIDEVCDLIVELNLVDRVYITGFVDSDEHLNNFVQELDVCVYPYDKEYYKYASSAAINVAISNARPTVVYPADSFVEINASGIMAICPSSNYYELARYIKEANYDELRANARMYAEEKSYPNEARNLIAIYRSLVA